MGGGAGRGERGDDKKDGRGHGTLTSLFHDTVWPLAPLAAINQLSILYAGSTYPKHSY